MDNKAANVSKKSDNTAIIIGLIVLVCCLCCILMFRGPRRSKRSEGSPTPSPSVSPSNIPTPPSRSDSPTPSSPSNIPTPPSRSDSPTSPSRSDTPTPPSRSDSPSVSPSNIPSPADGTYCPSDMTGVDSHYMNGECVRKEGCSYGFSLVNGTCISDEWYLPGGVGPHYLKYLTKEPDAKCQANGESYHLSKDKDKRYYQRALNCSTEGCIDEGKVRFCFKRTDENTCNSSASGYYGRGRNDRVKDCVWVPSLPASKIFNSEAEFIAASRNQ